VYYADKHYESETRNGEIRRALGEQHKV